MKGIARSSGIGPVLGAALLLAALLPICAVGGLKAAVDAVEMEDAQLAVSSVVVDRNGALLRPYPVADGRWRLRVTPDAVDPDYLSMLIAYEDRRFHRHHGVDARALFRAAFQAVGNGRLVSGASTLTMQVARLQTGRSTRSAKRKWRQILSALAMERRYDKAEILTRYLNRAPFGGNLEGVRTASLAYFGKEPLRLSAAEAALLVALPQAPEARRPDLDPEAARRARDRVLARALSEGLLDRNAHDRARAEPVPSGRRPMPVLAAHLSDRARSAAPEQETIRLTLDRSVQERLENLARQRVARLSGGASLAMMVADIETGDVIASVGSPDFFDRKKDGFVDMTQAVRSPGSTLKPLIYALAFSEGLAHPESLIDDRPVVFSGYAPTNFDRDYQGTVTVREALHLSLNVPAIQVLEEIGPARLMQTLNQLGARPVLPRDTAPNLAIGLGGIGMRLRDLVAVYGGIASGGRPIGLRTGGPDDRRFNETRSSPVLDPRAAWSVSSILSDVRDPNRLTGSSFAFKTGTTYGYRDAWAIGFDGRHVAGVWVGRPDGKPVPGLVGIKVAAPVLADLFARLGPLTPLPAAPPGIRPRRTADLPARLRHIGRAVAERTGGANGFDMAYPPHRARIDLADGETDVSPLFLKVRNGRLPLTFLVNGVPVATRHFAREAEWAPDTKGFVEIVVIDADGEAARSKVFLE